MTTCHKSETNFSGTADSNIAQSAMSRLRRARSMYGHASRELFELSYQIQRTGRLPEPRVLTEAVIHYRKSRALIEDLSSALVMATSESVREGEPAMVAHTTGVPLPPPFEE
jgi:hypothetical protein